MAADDTDENLLDSQSKMSKSKLPEGKTQDTLSHLKPSGFGCRHVIVLMSMLAQVNQYALRVNLSVALVAMVNQTAVRSPNKNSSQECLVNSSNHTAGSNSSADISKDGEFSWDAETQGIILGAFFYGYCVTQILGGWLADRFGAKHVIGSGLLITAVLTLLTPTAARIDKNLLIAVRVAEGCAEGLAYPAVFSILGKWLPPLEVSKYASFVSAGSNLGSVIAMAASGALCQSNFLGGWPSVFYLFGGLACVWYIFWLVSGGLACVWYIFWLVSGGLACVWYIFWLVSGGLACVWYIFWLVSGGLACVWYIFWLFLVFSEPNTHPRISIEEKTFINTALLRTGKETRRSLPWKAVIRSMPVWALIVGTSFAYFQFYTLFTSLPTYFEEILLFDINENGYLSALPSVVSGIVSLFAGYTADLLREHHVLSTVAVRRIYSAIGMLVPSGFLLAVGYAGCYSTAAVVLMTASYAFGGFTNGGREVNVLDFAPYFAGSIYGIMNTVSTIPGFIGPYLVGYFTEEKQTIGQWMKVFYIEVAITVVGCLFYVIFASGERQTWDIGQDKIKTSDETRGLLQKDDLEPIVNSVNA
ncbi:sialin-like isoform X1 [Lineus longissimus]|uniref:sialin-like isoform X1 n=1 Tax=Lineus longissimus TaxID=88925 RepID=UPI00315CDA03